MLAMQYSFPLPADYDMDIIERRILSKGHMLDGAAGLLFKAYQFARHDLSEGYTRDNLYAPFYLWEDSAAMNRFLSGPGFAAVSKAFGWPSVTTWSVVHARRQPGLAKATWSTRELLPVEPHADLSTLLQAEAALADRDVDERGALAAVVAFDPTGWTLVRQRLWDRYEAGFAGPAVQIYQIGHMSLPLRAD